MVVLCNIPVIEIGDPKIKENIKEKREIENDKIKPVITYSDNILNIPVDAEYKDRFNKKVKKKQESQVCQKFSLHIKKVKSFREQKLFRETLKKFMIFATKLII